MAEEAQETTETTEATEQGESSGLLDDVELPGSVDESKSDEAEIDHIDREAEGEKPDWLPARFWDEEKGADYEALAKSQDELYKKLRNGKHQAPEDGNYDLKFVGDKVPEDDELMTKFKAIASDRGLTQDDFEDIVGIVLENIPEAQEAPEAKFDKEAELAKLGPNGEEIQNGLVNWFVSLVEKDVMTKDDWGEFKVMAGTANGIRVFNRLRQYYGEKTIPVNAVPDMESMPNEDELRAMVADNRFREDPTYRKKVIAEFEKVYPNDGVTPNMM